MDRRAFLANVGVAAAWAAIAIKVSGCSEDNAGGTGPSDPCVENGSIASNHGHSVCLTNAQLVAGNGVTLTLEGGGHTHQITLSSQQVQLIANQTQVAVTSTSGGSPAHTHLVTFNA